MRISETEYQRRLIESLAAHSANEQTDNRGQIIIYTGMFLWDDGTIHDEQEVMEVRDNEYSLSEGQ